MPNESGTFYLLDDKLLYARKEFIGFDPIISKALTHERLKERFGTTIKVDEFDLPEGSFYAILINFMGSGPLRGYEGIEILKEGRTIIRYKKGGGMGAVYRDGTYFLVNDDYTYMLVDGRTLKANNMDKIYQDINAGSYYFFRFTDVIIPAVEEIVINYDSVLEKESYTIQDIKHLRQMEWYAEAVINDHEVAISESYIPGFSRIHRNSPGYEKFRKDKAGDMNETEIVVDGISQLS